MSSAQKDEARTYRLSLSASFELTSILADLLAQREEDPAPAISMHETKDPSIWGLDAYYQTKPDLLTLKKELEVLVSPLPELELKLLENQDWVALVQRGLSPIRAGRYFIYGSHDRALATKRATDIEIDAGQAFGTAHHGTTKGCLLALDYLFKNVNARPWCNILDLGTGTGLLAIAAARVLRRKVIASDIDPISVRVAAENAALNEVGPHIRTVEACGLAHTTLQSSGPYDLLIANILAAPLIEMAPDIRKSMRPKGQLILSGLLRTQSRSIEARYRGQGFTLVKRLPLDEWMTLILRYR